MNGLRYDLNTISKCAVGAAGLTILADIILALNARSFVAFADALVAGQIPNDQIAVRAETIDRLSQIIGIGYIGVFFLCVLISAIWIYRAAWNARELQAFEGRITPGWAVGWFFVPFMCLWKPFQAIRQTWNSSTDAASDPDRATPGFIRVWWGLWILTNIAGNVSFRLWSRAEEIDDMRAVAIFDIVTAPVSILTTMLFILLIRKVTAAQASRHYPF